MLHVYTSLPIINKHEENRYVSSVVENYSFCFPCTLLKGNTTTYYIAVYSVYLINCKDIVNHL